MTTPIAISNHFDFTMTATRGKWCSPSVRADDVERLRRSVRADDVERIMPGTLVVPDRDALAVGVDGG